MKELELNRKYAILMIVLGMIFILFFGNMWVNRNQEISKDELISVEGTLSNQLELKRKKSVGSSMIIQLKEYPNINYKIGRFSTSGLKLMTLQNNVKMGDKIQMDILKDDYSKIKLTQPKTISVYGLRNDKKEFLSVDNYNESKKEDRNSISMYLILGFSFWMLGYGMYLLMTTKKNLFSLSENR